jgi:hypothetical protein
MKFKNFVLAAMVFGTLIGCSEEPRGPVEVLGKTYVLNNDAPGALIMLLEFTKKDIIKVTAPASPDGKSVEWKYTLQGDAMTITIPEGKGGKETVVLDLHRNGNSFLTADSYFTRDRFLISPKSPADDARIEAQKKAVQERLANEAKRNQAIKAAQERRNPKGSPSDKSAYVPGKDMGDENNEWYVWQVMARTAEAQNEETRLGVLSRAWYSTKDAFAHQEMKAKELARINAKLADIGKINYISINDADIYGYYDHKIPNSFIISSIGEYDFKRKGFKIVGSICQEGKFNIPFGGKSGTHYAFTRSDENIAEHPFCFLPIADDDAARKMEAIRVAGDRTLRITTTVYAKIADVGSATLALVPIGADYSVYEVSRNKPLDLNDPITTVSYWPYK